MASIWDWWWNNVGAGGINKGEKKGEEIGGKVGHEINKAVGTPDTPTPREIGGAMSDIGDTVSFAKTVWLNVSDYRMWRSLGWLLLGILMLILGFVIWNRKSIQAAGELAGKAALL